MNLWYRAFALVCRTRAKANQEPILALMRVDDSAGPHLPEGRGPPQRCLGMRFGEPGAYRSHCSRDRICVLAGAELAIALATFRSRWLARRYAESARWDSDGDQAARQGASWVGGQSPGRKERYGTCPISRARAL